MSEYGCQRREQFSFTGTHKAPRARGPLCVCAYTTNTKKSKGKNGRPGSGKPRRPRKGYRARRKAAQSPQPWEH